MEILYSKLHLRFIFHFIQISCSVLVFSRLLLIIFPSYKKKIIHFENGIICLQQIWIVVNVKIVFFTLINCSECEFYVPIIKSFKIILSHFLCVICNNYYYLIILMRFSFKVDVNLYGTILTQYDIMSSILGRLNEYIFRFSYNQWLIKIGYSIFI